MCLITDHTRLHPDSDVLTSTLTADEVVILNIRDGTYFSLNHVGAALWGHLAMAPRTFAQLTAFVETHFAVSSDICQNDLKTFLKALLDHNLLHIH